MDARWVANEHTSSNKNGPSATMQRFGCRDAFAAPANCLAPKPRFEVRPELGRMTTASHIIFIFLSDARSVADSRNEGMDECGERLVE